MVDKEKTVIVKITSMISAEYKVTAISSGHAIPIAVDKHWDFMKTRGFNSKNSRIVEHLTQIIDEE